MSKTLSWLNENIGGIMEYSERIEKGKRELDIFFFKRPYTVSLLKLGKITHVIKEGIVYLQLNRKPDES